MPPTSFAAFRPRFESVREFVQRIELLAEIVRAGAVEDVVTLLGEVAHAAARRQPAALETILAWVVMSATPGNPLEPRERDLFREALRRDDPLLVTLFQPPFPVLIPEAPPAHVRAATDGRPLTLGERRAAARRGNRFLLDRLLADPDPGVVARLLRNPLLTEREVIRIAAWRPGRPEILLELLRCPRWAVRATVQAALLRNSALPVALATRLTLLLPLPKLREVYSDLETPLLVRLACERHLQLLGRKKRNARLQ